jgi:hypothetical protein
MIIIRVLRTLRGQNPKQSHFKAIQSHFFTPQSPFLDEFQGISTNPDKPFYAKQSHFFQKFKLKIKDLQLFHKVVQGSLKTKYWVPGRRFYSTGLHTV